MPSGAAVTSDAVIYLPGIMGSELVDDQGRVVWGATAGTLFRQIFFRDVFDRLIPRPDDGIRASRTIQTPSMIPFLSAVEPYTKLDTRLKQSVLHPDAVVAYPYDWRHSVTEAAEKLIPFANAHLQAWRTAFAAIDPADRAGLPEPKLTLVAHSMGGLVATWYATHFQDQGAAEVRRIITLGTPFLGSANAVQVLATGNKLPLGLYADSLRDAAQTMPGLYELVARYKSLDENGATRPRRLTGADLANIGASADLTEQAFDRMDTLMDKVTELPQDTLHCLVGNFQPTLQSLSIEAGVPTFAEATTDNDGHRADFGGDGTVFRYASAPAHIEALPVPQSHSSLAKTGEGINFAASKVTERPVSSFLGAGDLGVRTPELVEAGETFTATATTQGRTLEVMCTTEDADSSAPLDVINASVIDGVATIPLTITAPGLYRICVEAGSFSAVERLVMVVEPS